MLVRQTAELETNVVAVERLKEYSEVETEVIILKNMYTKGLYACILNLQMHISRIKQYL